MKDGFLNRTELLFGKDAIERLNNSRVAVFGLGGVGGHAAEALARSGVGTLDIVDSDTVSESNINRQIIANVKTVGREKTDVMKERLFDINPEITINVYPVFFAKDTMEQFDFSSYDYVVDAIDSVTSKILLITEAKNAGVRIISSMGTGNKMHPEMLEIADIYDTSVCPLAKVMRKELKKRGVGSLDVIYSREKPLKPDRQTMEEMMKKENAEKRQIPGSNAFVPASAGLLIASRVVQELIKE